MASTETTPKPIIGIKGKNGVLKPYVNFYSLAILRIVMQATLTWANKNKNITLAASAIFVRSNNIARVIITTAESIVDAKGVRYLGCNLLNTGGKS